MGWGHTGRRARCSPRFVDVLLENATGLDPAVALLDVVAAAIVRPGAVEGVLTGAWQGHAAHPFLTDIPIGFWTSASVLDVIGGRAARPAADRLLALGLVAALPTAATGLAEFRRTGPASSGSASCTRRGTAPAWRSTRRRTWPAAGGAGPVGCCWPWPAWVPPPSPATWAATWRRPARSARIDPAFGPDDHGPEVTGPTYGAEEAGAGPEEAVPDTASVGPDLSTTRRPPPARRRAFTHLG